ncbi:non-heme iron oxygenase ferredoxin subunit [Leucobacter sp. OH1287]|uniref:non-heme iron oxygenase ferredoxin subunit n=1 Tax=Leucobacter sp. OH1287 TaxID=2491049 RepID=UPI000F5EE3C0|nr:non-heme iron oxygenase ferredoxin subunit [Leucobacter sp. OH1287]RRD60943.1 non-heme iron oxygenase ferredoxin subunit [Leucobacter sp. OH1287]
MPFVRVCPAAEVQVDTPKRIEIAGQAIAVVRDSAGDVYAIGDSCTHGEISLSEGFVEDCTLECWAHGSRFSLKTGWPQNLPAYEPVPVYAVEITDDEIFIDPTPIYKDKDD